MFLPFVHGRWCPAGDPATRHHRAGSTSPPITRMPSEKARPGRRCRHRTDGGTALRNEVERRRGGGRRSPSPPVERSRGDRSAAIIGSATRRTGRERRSRRGRAGDREREWHREGRRPPDLPADPGRPDNDDRLDEAGPRPEKNVNALCAIATVCLRWCGTSGRAASSGRATSRTRLPSTLLSISSTLSPATTTWSMLIDIPIGTRARRAER